MLTANATDNPMFVISLDIDSNGQAKARIPDIEKSAQLHNTLLQGLFPDIRVARFNPHLARGNEDAEIRNRRLRPIQESFGDGTFVFGFDSIELAVFRRATRTDQLELHAIDLDTFHRLLDVRLLGFIEHTAGNIESRHTNLWK